MFSGTNGKRILKGKQPEKPQELVEDSKLFYGIDIEELKLFKDPMSGKKSKPEKKLTSPKAGANRRNGQLDLDADIAHKV